MAETLLRVNRLDVSFATHQGVVSPVREVSFQVNAHETLGIIGESGCGKSVTVQALMGLLSPRTSRVEGEVVLAGKALHSLPAKARRQISGREMAMIFQDPLASLNPVMTIGLQIDESLRLHTPLSRAQRWEKILSLLAQVGISEPVRCASAWPHELSGGMRQRTALLRALYSEWDVLFLDEPFKGLDEETKELVIEYTKKQCFGKTVIFVTHDRSEAGKMGGRLFKM